MRKQARLVYFVLVLFWKNPVCGEIDDFELLLVDFGDFIARCGRPLVKGSGTSCTMSVHAYEVVGGAVLASSGDECALHEELVLAFDGERRVLLHGLEQDWKSGSDMENVRGK